MTTETTATTTVKFDREAYAESVKGFSTKQLHELLIELPAHEDDKIDVLIGLTVERSHQRNRERGEAQDDKSVKCAYGDCDEVAAIRGNFGGVCRHCWNRERDAINAGKAVAACDNPAREHTYRYQERPGHFPYVMQCDTGGCDADATTLKDGGIASCGDHAEVDASAEVDVCDTPEWQELMAIRERESRWQRGLDKAVKDRGDHYIHRTLRAA